MNALKKWLFLRSIKKGKDKLPSKASARAWKSIKTIGLLFDATNQSHRKWASTAMETLRREGKNVSALAYAADHLPTENMPFQHFTKKDLDWLSRPRSEVVKEFLAHHKHLLIFPEQNPHPALEYILALTSADIKAGHYEENTNTELDLLIDLSGQDDPILLVAEIQKLLSTIKQKTPTHETVA